MTADHLLTPDEADAIAEQYRQRATPTKAVRTLEEYRRREPTLTRPLTDRPREIGPVVMYPMPTLGADDAYRVYQRTYNNKRRTKSDG